MVPVGKFSQRSAAAGERAMPDNSTELITALATFSALRVIEKASRLHFRSSVASTTVWVETSCRVATAQAAVSEQA